ncbi:MAG: aldehyde dehydrogenase family protein [Acidobacteriaceae bacterium]
MIQSLNPANGKLLRSFDPLTPEALNAKIAIAASATKTYPSEPLDQRIFWMRRLAALLEADLEELAATMTAEMGKTIVSARAEVTKCAAVCRYYADNAQRILAPERISTEHAESYVRYDPLGIVLAIMPWNFPLWQVFRFLAPALMAGNVGLLKHASNVPQCAIAIEALVRRAGFPRGAFQTLLIEARQVEDLLSDPRVAAVTVTGSEAAGRAIAAQAGWLIKKTVLELGGSDPFIVLPSADLDAAVDAAIKARCINNGQSCIAAKRFIIHESIYPEFEQRFVAGMAALHIGDPMLDTTDIGPIATPQGVEDLLDQVTRARESGGRVLTGGARAIVEGGRFGNYFEPTVIAGVMRNTPIAQEEIFGPVALLFRVASLAEAIQLANDTPFGLAASAWSTDDEEKQRLAIELQCGAVFFNAPVSSDPRLPFGGIKHSGYGRELASVGMREFLNAKTVVVAATANPSQPNLLDQQKSTPRFDKTERSEKPTEFQQIFEHIRKFEPRKTGWEIVEPQAPEPKSIEPAPPEPQSIEPATPEAMEPLPTAPEQIEPQAEAPQTPSPQPPSPQAPSPHDDDTQPEDANSVRASILGLR